LGEHGVRGVLKQEKATYIPTWASRKELTGYLNQYKPDLVLITLGGNELGIGKPEERAETIARLVKRFEGTPCVWIGIPLWKGANPTLLEVIRKNVAPCRYLDSNALVPNLERAKDQIHPSLNARKVWAEAVVRWLAEQRVPNADKPWALK
jgi:lysophospholipase L1-like esterase